MTALAPRPRTLHLLHHGPDLHVYEVADAADEDAHLWPGLGPPQVEQVEAAPVDRNPGIPARQVLDWLAHPAGASEPALWHRLLTREGRHTGLWVQEVVRPGFWRGRAVHQLRDAAIEWGVWATRRRMGAGL